jgi:hypothetical protein
MYRNFARLPAVYRTFPGVFFIGKSRLDDDREMASGLMPGKGEHRAMNAGAHRVIKVLPGRFRPILIALIFSAVTAVCFYAESAGFNSIELRALMIISCVIVLAALLLLFVQRPLLEVHENYLFLRDGLIRSPFRVELKHVAGFKLAPSDPLARLAILIHENAVASYRPLGLLASPDLGSHFVVPLMWTSMDKKELLRDLNERLASSH